MEILDRVYFLEFVDGKFTWGWGILAEKGESTYSILEAYGASKSILVKRPVDSIFNTKGTLRGKLLTLSNQTSQLATSILEDTGDGRT